MHQSDDAIVNEFIELITHPICQLYLATVHDDEYGMKMMTHTLNGASQKMLTLKRDYSDRSAF